MRIRRRSDRRASLTRRIGSVLLLGVLASVVPMLHPEAVSAASGVDDYPSRLRNAPQDSLVDPWDFYNRECTSFVAWRLNSENQVAFTDYWLGQHWGNAYQWKSAANALGIPVDNNPTRGAVAWWARGSAGSSRGHVAWVETVGDSAITVEEYNYLHEGGYDTRTISSSSSLWPSGFIHIKDTQVRNTAAPTVSGTAQVGQKLVTTNGSWSAKNLTFAYQWLANGSPIAGATKRSFTPGAGQVGKQIRARVTATKSGAHSGTAKSPATPAVAKGVFVNSAAPTVAGTAQVGVPLASAPGTWSPKGTIAYQWYANGVPITGATTASFTPTADQLGLGVKVRVSMSAPGYKTMRVASVRTGSVLPGQFQASTAPTVSGVAQVDQPLTATAGTWTPPGSITYQWLANGAPISGATGTTYSPTPDDLRKNISIQVTVAQRGYDDAVATSAATLGVAPGTFLNTAAPAISGKAQVGVPLTADKGMWSPRPELTYQWLVDGVEVPGATAKSFTPRPEDLGKKVTLEVTASRAGYLAATVPSSATPAVLPGTMVNKAAPVVSGRAVVGHTLSTTDGAWSVTPDSYGYQWYAGGTPIAGATSATYQPTAADAGRHLHVVVTARSAGYTPLSASSTATSKVVFGTISFDKPTIRGRGVVGRTLTAHVTGVYPSSATPSFRWYRGPTPIRGASAATYVVQAADLGARLHVVVTMRATDWLPRVRQSVSITDIRTAPQLQVHTSIRHGRVFLRMAVVSPGVASPTGTARVWLRGQRVGLLTVADGQASRLLASMSSGTHVLRVVYRGGPHELVASKLITVTIP